MVISSLQALADLAATLSGLTSTALVDDVDLQCESAAAAAVALAFAFGCRESPAAFDVGR